MAENQKTYSHQTHIEDMVLYTSEEKPELQQFFLLDQLKFLGYQDRQQTAELYHYHIISRILKK